MKIAISKTVEPTGDLCITFTDEELTQLGITKGDKFSFEEKDGGFLLKKYQKIDIDLKEFSRETLELLVTLSCEKDISINEVIENVLTEYINLNEY